MSSFHEKQKEKSMHRGLGEAILLLKLLENLFYSKKIWRRYSTQKRPRKWISLRKSKVAYGRHILIRIRSSSCCLEKGRWFIESRMGVSVSKALKFIEGFCLYRTERWSSSHRRVKKCLPSMKDRKRCLSIEE